MAMTNTAEYTGINKTMKAMNKTAATNTVENTGINKTMNITPMKNTAENTGIINVTTMVENSGENKTMNDIKYNGDVEYSRKHGDKQNNIQQ